MSEDLVFIIWCGMIGYLNGESIYSTVFGLTIGIGILFAIMFFNRIVEEL